MLITVSLGALFLIAMALGVVATVLVIVFGLLAEDLIAFLREGEYNFKVEVIATSTGEKTIIRRGETILPPIDNDEDEDY